MLQKAKKKFPFLKNDVVLARYGSELYYAKILTINYKRKLAKLLFDDDSKEEISFRKIYSVNEETSDIICIICKKDRTDQDNDIVLCDSCDVGYHQMCHEPYINSKVLKPEIPWECIYCTDIKPNPYVSENPFENNNESDSGQIVMCSDDEIQSVKQDCNAEMDTIEDDQNSANEKLQDEDDNEIFTIDEIDEDICETIVLSEDESLAVDVNTETLSINVHSTLDSKSNDMDDSLLQKEKNSAKPGEIKISSPEQTITSNRDNKPVNNMQNNGTSINEIKDTNNHFNTRDDQSQVSKTEIKKPIPRRTSFVDSAYFDEALSLLNKNHIQHIPKQENVDNVNIGVKLNFNWNTRYNFLASEKTDVHQSEFKDTTKLFVPRASPPAVFEENAMVPSSICSPTISPNAFVVSPSLKKSPTLLERHYEECVQKPHSRTRRSHSIDYIRERNPMKINRTLSTCQSDRFSRDGRENGFYHHPAERNLSFSKDIIPSPDFYHDSSKLKSDIFFLDKSRHHSLYEKEQLYGGHLHKPSTSPSQKSCHGPLEIQIVTAQIRDLENHIKRQEEEIQARKALLNLNGINYEDNSCLKLSESDYRMQQLLRQEEENDLKYHCKSQKAYGDIHYHNSLFTMSSESPARRSRLYSDSTVLHGERNYEEDRNFNELKRTYSVPSNTPPTAKKTRTAIMIPSSSDFNNNNNSNNINLFEAPSYPPSQLNKSNHYQHSIRTKPIRRSHSIELHNDVYMKKATVTRSRCTRCQGPAEFLCGACKNAWYCTQHCQLSDWNRHVRVCADN